MSACWQFPTKKVVNKRWIGTNQHVFCRRSEFCRLFVDHELYATVWSKPWRRVVRIYSLEVVRDPFSNLYLQFVHEFRISFASLGCLLKVILVSPDMFVCIPHVYKRVRTNTGRAFEVYNFDLPPTEPRSLSESECRSFFVVLPAFRFAGTAMFTVDSARRVKRENNKMETGETSPQVLFTSCSCADEFIGRLLWLLPMTCCSFWLSECSLPSALYSKGFPCYVDMSQLY